MFSDLKIITETFSCYIKRKQFSTPNKFLMLSCSESFPLERNRLGITRQMRNTLDHRTRMHVTEMINQPLLNIQKAGVFAFTKPEQCVLCGLGHNALAAFSNKVTYENFRNLVYPFYLTEYKNIQVMSNLGYDMSFIKQEFVRRLPEPQEWTSRMQ